MNRILVVCVVVLLDVAVANAQTEEVEPRVVGGSGVTSIGLSGFVDKFMSAEETFPFNVTAHVDVTRFVTRRLAVRGGVIGSGRFGGDGADEQGSGPGVASLHALAGAHWYFTPDAMVSFYTGGEYRAQLTGRPERDAGSLLGKAGVEAAISSRTNVFVEGGYGLRLTRGSNDERQTRIVGELGLRIKF